MAETIIIGCYGESGTGKTTSCFPDEEAGIKGLNPAELFVINCAGPGKKFPVPSDWIESYRHSNEISKKSSHMYVAPTLVQARDALVGVINTRPDIKYILVDDVGVGASKKVTGSTAALDYEDWRMIGVQLQNLINAASTFTNRDVFVFLMFHAERYGPMQDKTRILTPGKLVRDYMGGVEGQLSTVFEAFTVPKGDDPDSVDYYFKTQSANSTAKSLRGMFPPRIPNDMGLVVDLYCKHQKIKI